MVKLYNLFNELAIESVLWSPGITHIWHEGCNVAHYRHTNKSTIKIFTIDNGYTQSNGCWLSPELMPTCAADPRESCTDILTSTWKYCPYPHMDITYLKCITNDDKLAVGLLNRRHFHFLVWKPSYFIDVYSYIFENKSSLFRVMAWRCTCLIRPQWVNVFISRFPWLCVPLYMYLVLGYKCITLSYLWGTVW